MSLGDIIKSLSMVVACLDVCDEGVMDLAGSNYYNGANLKVNLLLRFY